MFNVYDNSEPKTPRPTKDVLKSYTEEYDDCRKEIIMLKKKLKKLENRESELEENLIETQIWEALSEKGVIYYVCWESFGSAFNWKGVNITKFNKDVEIVGYEYYSANKIVREHELSDADVFSREYNSDFEEPSTQIAKAIGINKDDCVIIIHDDFIDPSFSDMDGTEFDYGDWDSPIEIKGYLTAKIFKFELKDK